MHDLNPNPWMPYMQAMGINDPYSNLMFTAPEQQLERMYPKVYYIINPVVVRHCDMMHDTYGPDYIPSNEQMETMTENIANEVAGRVDSEILGGEGQSNPTGRNPFLRGLVGVLLIRELLGRRRRPFRRFPRYPYPGYYPGFY